jgi:hypothetical protein
MAAALRRAPRSSMGERLVVGRGPDKHVGLHLGVLAGDVAFTYTACLSSRRRETRPAGPGATRRSGSPEAIRDHRTRRSVSVSVLGESGLGRQISFSRRSI